MISFDNLFWIKVLYAAFQEFMVNQVLMDMLCFECHFYSLILMAYDAKRVTCSENYSSKFNCPMIENLVQLVLWFSRL